MMTKGAVVNRGWIVSQMTSACKSQGAGEPFSCAHGNNQSLVFREGLRRSILSTLLSSLLKISMVTLPLWSELILLTLHCKESSKDLRPMTDWSDM